MDKEIFGGLVKEGCRLLLPTLQRSRSLTSAQKGLLMPSTLITRITLGDKSYER